MLRSNINSIIQVLKTNNPLKTNDFIHLKCSWLIMNAKTPLALEAILTDFSKKGYYPNTIVINELISKFGQYKMYDEAISLFRFATIANLANVTTYNCTLDIVAESKHTNTQLAIMIFNEVKQKGLADVDTYSIIIKVIARSKYPMVHLRRTLLEEAKQLGFVDSITYGNATNSSVTSDVTTKNNHPDTETVINLNTLIQRLQTDCTLISADSNNAYLECSLSIKNTKTLSSLLRKINFLLNEGYYPNTVIFQQLISRLVRHNMQQYAIKLFDIAVNENLADEMMAKTIAKIERPSAVPVISMDQYTTNAGIWKVGTLNQSATLFCSTSAEKVKKLIKNPIYQSGRWGF